jgi:hypothetical protein
MVARNRKIEFIHDRDSRLRDAVAQLVVLTEQKLREEIWTKKQGNNLPRCHLPNEI